MRIARNHALSASVLLAAVVAGATGCTATGLALAAGAAAGAATVIYVQGDLETELDATPTQVASATERALEDLELKLVETEVSELDGRIEAESSEEKSIVIKLKSLEDGRTRTSIRVGNLGDEGLSLQILDRIKEHLVT